MKSWIWKILVGWCILLFVTGSVKARDTSIVNKQRFIHRLELEMRPEFVFPTNPFLQGLNQAWKPIRSSYSAHLKYSFQYPPSSTIAQVYGGAYQGTGLAYYTFGDRQQLGNPIVFYLFQGARIACLASWLSFNYEWNFGLSGAWKPYDAYYNPYNKMMGSRVNAYINTNFYLNWMLTRRVDLVSGITLSHFSNGNTRLPNAGLNTIGFKVGMVYHYNRKIEYLPESEEVAIGKFPRHISYDLVLFGSWRRKGIVFGEEQVASPEAYPVAGFNITPMYNLGYKFRVGISLDGVYDGSANIYTEDYIVGTNPEFFTPPLYKQLALGLSGRAEYVMPYFTIGIGVGANVLHGGGDLNALYQILALKVRVTHNSFLHVGYNLQNFKTPSFLMLGIGVRFNNKHPLF